jgi:hypothetical protein
VNSETMTALRNYDWLARDRGLGDVALDWETGTLAYGHGGVLIEELARPGFTTATDEDAPAVPREQPASPPGSREIASHARQYVQCQACGAQPGLPCAGHDRIVCKSRYVAAAIALKRQVEPPSQTPEQATILAGLPCIPKEEIEKCRTERGGYSFTRAWFLEHCLPYPRPSPDGAGQLSGRRSDYLAA